MLHDMHALCYCVAYLMTKKGFVDHMHANVDVIHMTDLVLICESLANRDRELFWLNKINKTCCCIHERFLTCCEALEVSVVLAIILVR